MTTITFLAAGTNATRVYGLTAAERARRFAVKAGLEPHDRASGGGTVVANLAFAWDPSWLREIKSKPGTILTMGGLPVLAHATDPETAAALQRAIANGDTLPAGLPLAERRVEDGLSLYNAQLRKREEAYVLPLGPDTARAVEKASYDGAYKGVTDLLTLYLWRGLAFHLTRWAAAARITPNAITLVGIALCVAAFFLFQDGRYWSGIAVGLGFMVLDTVDGKLARTTGTSSAWGNILDHGVDLVHPPFWYWAWGAGLAVWGRSMPADTLWMIIAAILIGYVVQRVVEGAFMRSFGGIHIHVWERIDSRFRLITARRNPNMVILTVALLLGRPDAGLIAVAWWTGLSCVFHVVRLVQAYARRASGRPVTSWLA